MPYYPDDQVQYPQSQRKTIGVAYPWRLPDFRLVPRMFNKIRDQGLTVKDVLKKQGL